MDLPRVLIVDDQLGGVRSDGRNRLREDFCFNVGVRDVTGDVAAESISDPIAEVVFFRGQVVQDGHVRNDLAGTIEIVRKGWRTWPRWTLMLLDMQFITGTLGDGGEPDVTAADTHPENYFGMTILEQLWRDPVLRDIPLVILSSMSRTQIEHRFVDHGALDFIDKNELNRNRLQQLVEDYGLYESMTMIGRSVPFLKCLREARQRAKIGNDNILLLGESGTGKDPLARYIHDSSPRRNNPYVTVYTQGVPETLIDDRLFGHVKGAFNGAIAAQPGAAEAANHGTLFIDEFGDLSASIQSKFLRLLEKNTRETQRIGAAPNALQRLDLQVILATNRMNLLESENFRPDLLNRVRISDPIRIPALRERQEDIPLLAEYFVRKYERTFADSLGAERREISPDAIQALCEGDWPGNVRDVEQLIESAVYRFPKLRVLSAMHLRLSEHRAVHSITHSTTQYSAPPTPKVSLEQLLQQLETLDFPEGITNRSEWAGKLPELERVFARASASLLKAALAATRKSTSKNPEGVLKIHPAVKLAAGDDSLTASEAADAIKRIVKMRLVLKHPTILAGLEADPVLMEAYMKARDLR